MGWAMAQTDSKAPKGERIIFAISSADKAAIDDWRRRQPSIPSRSEAIRALIRLGLEAATPDK